MDLDHHALEPEPADGHPRSGLDRSLRLGRGLCAGASGLRAGLEAANDTFECSARVGAHGASLTGADARRRSSRRLVRQLVCLRFQSLDDRVDLATALAQLIVELRVESAAVGVFPLADRLFARTKRSLRVSKRCPFFGQRPAIGLEPAQILIDARQMFRELLLAIAQVLARRSDHVRRQSQARRDLDGQTASGRSVHQPVGRRERLRLEPERRALDSLGRRCVRLQRIVVRRRDEMRAALAEVIDDGDAERTALDRIRARTDFVHEHERRKRERTIHRDDVRDVSREGAQARGDRLLVADVGKE